MRQSRYDVAPERARLTIDDHDEDHDDEPASSAGRNGTSTAGKEKDNGLRRFPGCGGGILDDITRRARYCGLDYSNGAIYGSKTLSAALFMLFATMFSTVALGALIESATKKRIGLSEYLIMNSLAGVTHALLGAHGFRPCSEEDVFECGSSSCDYTWAKLDDCTWLFLSDNSIGDVGAAAGSLEAAATARSQSHTRAPPPVHASLP